MSETVNPNDCPACLSSNTIAYPYGDSDVDKAQKKRFPDARQCVDCKYSWMKPAAAWVGLQKKQPGESQ